MKKKIQILGMKLDNYSVRESILLAESYLNGTSLNAIEDISMKMLMESENNEVLGQALQEMDMTIIGEKRDPYGCGSGDSTAAERDGRT